jgi:hypothetical protein
MTSAGPVYLERFLRGSQFINPKNCSHGSEGQGQNQTAEHYATEQQ